ncbi:MAG TPA: hypothetical protein VN408_23925 [Actinoplanes sp.]|nr:hypothetical protein [Actinoplanes sp.]
MRIPRPTLGATADVVGLVLAALAAISFIVGRLGWLLGLSIAVVATGALADPYYFHGQAEATERGWVVRTIEIGLEPTAADPGIDAGARIDILAQLVTEETARVLRDRANIVIVPAGPDNQWLLRDLPGRTVDTLRVERAPGLGACE